ncbi:MAG: TIGR01777 family protein [Candidatus Lindowbacteria bacterium RIFCSPLOWO2_12_FULL_62_27]|nr:MAG: TIGR01777 family protein [Candidatus Lindowbacteria bacterium RIFCSPLOWO2_12_FULL_62_27]OGH61182.1 MAG: TIGR01777 family protein [Candidatus Lindowbacteria bacterium RIFCSPLOWO2_02_FULL_62_12]
MRILISGSTGLVGTVLDMALQAQGHAVARLVRSAPNPGHAEVRWDPAAGKIDEGGIEGVDAVVHLAGENVGARRWTATQKNKIRSSRVNGTRTLCEAIQRLKKPPASLLSASAVGIYGDRGEETLTEASPAGAGFLPEVCVEWEKAAAPAAQRGIRVAHLRIGVVLSAQGGALGRMLLPFKLGLGGPIGAGRQYMSWISVDDAVRAISFVLDTKTLIGPVNLVAPRPVTNREFSKTLGRTLHRPAIFPMPAFAARLAFGEMADALLLASARVVPGRLEAAGFSFAHPDLATALKHILGRS